jgi:D-alanyl-D-alanine carboxypeptidase
VCLATQENQVTQFNPTAIKSSVSAIINSYDGPAPALIFEAYRDGVSISSATGTVGFDDPTLATTDDKFEIGSQTKMMTTTVLLQLVDEGNFSLDDRLAEVMDVTPLSWMANIDEVTVRQLMTHTSGIPDFLNDVKEVESAIVEMLSQDPPQPVGPDTYLALLEMFDPPALSEPGAEYSYSNTGFLLLGLLIEEATGNTLAEEFQSRIFDPAGMTSSSLPGFDRPDGILQSYNANSGQVAEVTNLPIADLGDGGVVSTTGDMIRFMKALLIDGSLVPESQGDALEEYFAAGGGIGEDGLIGQGGGTFGTASITLFDPATGTIFSAAETMRYGPDSPSELAFQAFFDLLENPAWTADYIDGDTIDFVATAAELEVSEAAGTDGRPDTLLKLDGVTLKLDARLSDIETETLNFEDGSMLFVADTSGSNFNVQRDAREATTADNQLVGLTGDDRLIGGRGDDKISGGAGDDTLSGRRGDDEISGSDGDDSLAGNRGDDHLSGDHGADIISGGRGDDWLDGGNGDDLLRGGRGDDQLSGGTDDDVLRGGRGNDTLDGGEGDDILVGGRGADTFVFGTNSGDDVIRNFESGKDQIDLSILNLTFDDLQVSENRDGRSFEVQFHDASIVINTLHGELTESDFLF